jgi:hypothetical protein
MGEVIDAEYSWHAPKMGSYCQDLWIKNI